MVRVLVAVDLDGLTSEICQEKEMVKYLYLQDGISDKITMERFIL